MGRKPGRGAPFNFGHPLCPGSAWLFNEGSGVQARDSGKTADHAKWSSEATGSAPSWTGNGQGQTSAGNFSTNSNYLTTTQKPVPTFSLFGRANFQSSGAYGNIFSSSTGGYLLLIWLNNQFQLWSSGEGYSGTTIGSSLTNGWHTFALTRSKDSGTWTLYYDGVQIGTLAANTLGSLTNPFWIGSRSDGAGQYFSGGIDYLYYYPGKCLTYADVIKLNQDPFCWINTDYQVPRAPHTTFPFLGSLYTTGSSHPAVPNVSSGNTLILFAYQGADQPVTATGYTSLGQINYDGGSGPFRLAVLMKTSSGGETTATLNFACNTLAIAMQGAYVSEGFAGSDNAASTTAVAPSVTSGGSGRLLINFISSDGGAVTAIPIGMNEIIGSSFFVAGYQTVGSGATGTRWYTLASSSPNGALSIVLAQSSAGIFDDEYQLQLKNFPATFGTNQNAIDDSLGFTASSTIVDQEDWHYTLLDTNLAQEQFQATSYFDDPNVQKLGIDQEDWHFTLLDTNLSQEQFQATNYYDDSNVQFLGIDQEDWHYTLLDTNLAQESFQPTAYYDDPNVELLGIDQEDWHFTLLDTNLAQEQFQATSYYDDPNVELLGIDQEDLIQYPSIFSQYRSQFIFDDSSIFPSSSTTIDSEDCALLIKSSLPEWKRAQPQQDEHSITSLLAVSDDDCRPIANIISNQYVIVPYSENTEYISYLLRLRYVYKAAHTSIQVLKASHTATQILRVAHTAIQVLKASHTATQTLKASHTAIQILKASHTMAIINQSISINQDEDTTIAFDLPPGESVASAQFGLADCATGTQASGFPILFSSGNISILPTGGVGGVYRILITIPNSATKTIPLQVNCTYTLWDDSSSTVNQMLASGPVVVQATVARK